MERKAVLEVQSAKGRQVHCIVATLNHPDADRDTIKSGFFSRAPMESLIVPAHRWESPPLGRAETWEAGSVIKSILTFNSTQAAAEWFSAIADDFETGRPLQRYSWGFRAHPDAQTRTKEGRLLHARPSGEAGIMLFEISPVLQAASVGTMTTAVKSQDWRLAMLRRIEQRRRTWR
jgi:hypothetical protein